MLAKTHESTLVALERSPVIQAARRVMDDERRARREGMLQRIKDSTKELTRIDADLVAKAAPLEKKLAALRAEIASVEAGLIPLAQSRLAAMSASDGEIARLRKELISDARTETEEMKRSIEITRAEISSNSGGQRLRLLNATVAVSNQKIVRALAILLDAYREVERISAEEVDVRTALETVRSGLSRSGIRLVGSEQ